MKVCFLASWLPIIRRLPGTPCAVALSFDDGPTPETTPDLLRILEEFNAKATFFVTGERAEQHPELVAAIVAQGHTIYAHAWHHIRMDRISPQQLIADMTRTEALLSRFRPTPSPYLVRLPYAGGYRNPRVHRTLRRWNPSAQIAHWSLHFSDPDIARDCRTQEAVEAAAAPAVAQVLKHPDLKGAIVLLHELAYDIDSPMRRNVSLRLASDFLAGLQSLGLTCQAITPIAKPSLWSRVALR